MTFDRQAERRTPPQKKSTFTAAVRSLLVFAACVLGIPPNADAGTAVVVGSAYGANDAAAALSGLSEGSRHNAIASMVRSGQLQGPLSAADGVLILSGTSQHIRSASIAELARLFKADLTGQEAATIFGPAAALGEGDRHGAIAALARAKRFGPSLGGDAGLALDGTTQHIRAASIAELAPYLRTDMRGELIVAILGTEQVLNEGNRHGAIAALARAKRIPQALTAAEAVPILAGTTKHIRAASIDELARFFATALSGEDAAAILGRNGETTEGDRLSGITALARAGKLRPGFNGHEVTLVLQGTSDHTRAAAIGEISASAVKQAAAPPRGPSQTTNATQAQSAESAQSFDGTYYNAQLAFGFRITGNQAVTTVSNSPTYKPGDIMLRFTPSGPTSFTGEQLCADGVFHPVTGTRASNGSIDMTIQGCLPSQYTMAKVAPDQAASIFAPSQSIWGPTSASTPALPPSPSLAQAAPLPKLAASDMAMAAHAYQFALLAQAVYEVPAKSSVEIAARNAPIVWQLVGTVMALPGAAPGLKAAVYLSSAMGAPSSAKRCAIVFSGTDMSSGQDWANNAAQLLGTLPPQYRLGAEFARQSLNGPCRGITTVITGHSLGGGIAQYAYLQTGETSTTFTFNPAGLAPTNLDFQVANLRRSGNVVNFIANAFSPSTGIPVGRDVVSLSGVTLGAELLVPVYSWSPYTHGMGVLVEGLRIQRDYCLAAGGCR